MTKVEVFGGQGLIKADADYDKSNPSRETSPPETPTRASETYINQIMKAPRITKF